MALLSDIKMGALPNDPDKKIDSLTKHINEQSRIISNEDRTKIIKSDSGIETVTLGQLPTGGNGLLIKDSDNVNRALFGEYPDGDIAVKVSKPGKNVATAADDELIFNSNQNVLKVVGTGSASLDATSGGGWYTYPVITHGLGFLPMVLGSCNSPAFGSNQWAMLPYTQIIGGTDYVINAQILSITENTLQFGVELGDLASGSFGTWNFKYYLLQETANLG